MWRDGFGWGGFSMFGITRAPDFPKDGLSWFNVDRPLSLSDLKGRLVILDFWTFCCVNCFHVQPTLRDLQDRFGHELAVIGVHSPKFTHERDPRALASALARYDIRHPVLHDPDMVMWDAYCVRAWPTLVFVGPDGRVIGQLAGEPNPDRLSEGLEDLLAQLFQRGALRPGPLTCAPHLDPGGGLRFPGKIKPGPGGGYVIADSGHHQIVWADEAGREQARFGTGEAGFRDGDCRNAAFNAPEGLVADDHFIYVADTRNHAIRRIEAATGWVETLAGLGLRGGTLSGPEMGLTAALASPWDLEHVHGTLYFANAGSHQIGALDLATRQVRRVAGTGAENISDAKACSALLAQPSGLALVDGDWLYFTDAESSAIRVLHLADGKVETLAGTGLFDFGHKNGGLSQARFQHPLGLTADRTHLYVADSYNGAVRVIDLAAERVCDLALPDCLAEPAGLCLTADGGLLISETNRHRLLYYDLVRGAVRVWMQ